MIKVPAKERLAVVCEEPLLFSRNVWVSRESFVELI